MRTGKKLRQKSTTNEKLRSQDVILNKGVK